MRLFAQWLPILLCSWAGRVGATSECAPSSGNFTILSPDNVTTLNQCTTFTGNISVAAKGIKHIILDGLKTITGTLEVTDVETVLSISSTTLESVSALTFKNLSKLTTLTLPALNNFSKLDLSNLKDLKTCEIATGTLENDVRDITVMGTALESMDWLRWPAVSSMLIAANMNLTSFKLPYDKIDTGSSYQFSINKGLNNLDFSQLSGIYGSLTINGNGNSDLGFDKLETIDGYVRISGNLTNMTMPMLTSINGALRAESSRDILSFCNWLDSKAQFSGHYDCTANDTNPSPITSSTVSKVPVATAGLTVSVKTNATSSDNDTSDRESGLSTGAIVGVAVAMVVVISIILTSTVLLLFHRRSRDKVQAALTPEGEKNAHSASEMGEELDASGIDCELEETEKAYELPTAALARELDSKSLQEMECEKPYFRDQKPALDSPVGRFELP